MTYCLKLRQSAVFSKADLSGYWYVKLDMELSYLTAFQPCCGWYRWLRRPFGLNVSSVIFQKKILNALSDLHGVSCIADVVINGKQKEEHDRCLTAFMERCREMGVRLNAEKMVQAVDTITFMAHYIGKAGLGIEKVSAIADMKEP